MKLNNEILFVKYMSYYNYTTSIGFILIFISSSKSPLFFFFNSKGQSCSFDRKYELLGAPQA